MNEEKVYKLEVTESQYKQLIILICNAQLDGSLLCSLQEQHEMQDTEPLPTSLHPYITEQIAEANANPDQ